jgi:hypothetical protein
MASERQPIDITNLPALRALVAEAQASDAPRILRAEGEDIAILTPLRPASRRHAPSETDVAAFLATAGGWQELVDTERLKEDIATSRRLSSRPPVEL